MMSVKEFNPEYPPNENLEETLSSYINWLLQDDAIVRRVVLVNEIAVGHIALTTPHGYLEKYFDEHNIVSTMSNGFGEISKFYVHPNHQNKGLGLLLLNDVINESEKQSKQPALSILSTATDAIQLCQSVGFVEVGSVMRSNGKNNIYIKE